MKTLTKRRAVFIIIAAAVLLAVIILLCSNANPKLDTVDGRVEYLASLGWEVDPATETRTDTVLPEEPDSVFKKYCELQLQQGFDLERYAGLPCEVYGYRVTNYPNGDTNVIAQLMISDGQVIGGDIHSTALDGFMHGLK